MSATTCRQITQQHPLLLSQLISRKTYFLLIHVKKITSPCSHSTRNQQSIDCSLFKSKKFGLISIREAHHIWQVKGGHKNQEFLFDSFTSYRYSWTKMLLKIYKAQFPIVLARFLVSYWSSVSSCYRKIIQGNIQNIHHSLWSIVLLLNL